MNRCAYGHLRPQPFLSAGRWYCASCWVLDYRLVEICGGAEAPAAKEAG